MKSPEPDDRGRDDEPSDDTWDVAPTRRRTLLRAAAAGALGSATALAGCTTGTRRYEADAVSLAPRAEEQGYALENESTSEVTREQEVAGSTLEVTLVSQLASYERSGSDFVDSVAVGLASTPAAEEAGVALNPIADRPLRELLTGDVGGAFLRQVDVGTGWQRGPERVGSGSGTLLGEAVQFRTFAGITAEGDFALVNVVRVRDGDDAVLVGDSRTKPVQTGNNPFLGQDGYVTRATVDEAAGMFADLLPLVVHGGDVSTPTGGETGETAAIYEVVSGGASPEAAESLAGELDLSQRQSYRDENGVIQYVDEDAYMPVPVSDVRGADAPDEESDGGRDVSMVLDVDALAELPEPPNGDQMLAEFESALDAAGLHPGANWPGTVESSVSHSTFGLENPETGNVELERDLDTAVYLRASLDGVPVEGPGAKIRGRVSDIGEGHTWADVRYSFRDVRVREQVQLVPGEQATERYRRAIEDSIDADAVELDEPRLIYFAPELGRRSQDPVVGDGEDEVRELLPHYEVGGTATIGEQEVELLREYVPAVDDGEYVPDPTASSAEASGNEVTVGLVLEGGRSPYSVDLALADGTVGPVETVGADPPEFSAPILLREPVEETTLTVEVTDANGVTVRRRTSLSVGDAQTLQAVDVGLGVDVLSAFAPERTDDGPSVAANSAGAAVPGTNDVGHEATDYTNWADGYVSMARAVGVDVNNVWQNNAVWEKDFKDSTDGSYGIDTADHTFTAAHGNPMGFAIPNSSHDDGFVHHTNADEAWGNHDLEWHSLMSCNVMAPDDGQCGGCNGKSRVQRWWQEFDGLHQLHGMQTLGFATKGFPEALAVYTFGYSILSPKKMRNAWFLAVDNYQPGYSSSQRWRKRGVVMGPMDADGNCTVDDYFWGRGQVGPDIPHERVDRIWWIVAATGGG